MLNKAHGTLPLAVFVVLFIAGVPSDADAAVVGVKTPDTVATTSGQNATLAIPRWKGYMDHNQPERFWLSYSNASTSASNMVFTTDGGESWQSPVLNPDATGHLDYHVALVGAGGDLYFTFPGNTGVGVRRFRAPAQSNADRDPLDVIPNTTPGHRSSVTVDGNGRLWIFTRDGDNPSANVRYAFSDNQGGSWSYGVAVTTGAPNVRIGSMPLADGRVCLVVLHLNDSRGYEYYVWNGSQFEAPSDHSIHAENIGYSRAFTHNVVADNIHLIFGRGNEMRHVWKAHDDGVGSWQEDVIFTSSTTDAMDMRPTCTVRGDELYLFYCKWTGSLVATSRIYSRVWSQTSETWGEEIAVSGGSTSTNVHPNTCFHVPSSSEYIPVFWTAGSSGTQVVYSALELEYSDEIPPAPVYDLLTAAGSTYGSVDLEWTAPGDDGDEGYAAAYDIRYSETVIQASSWIFATQVLDEPIPDEAGVIQSMVIEGLDPGTVYYFAMKAQDDEQNVSFLSNVPRFSVPSHTDTPDVDSQNIQVLPNYPNPFNPRTSIPFVLPRETRAWLAVHDMTGRLTAVLVNETLASGRHVATWNGLGRDGEAMPSGIYHVRLTVGDEVSTGRITLLR